mgnify:CR=1 FL=1
MQQLGSPGYVAGPLSPVNLSVAGVPLPSGQVSSCKGGVQVDILGGISRTTVMSMQPKLTCRNVQYTINLEGGCNIKFTNAGGVLFWFWQHQASCCRGSVACRLKRYTTAKKGRLACCCTVPCCAVLCCVQAPPVLSQPSVVASPATLAALAGGLAKKQHGTSKTDMLHVTVTHDQLQTCSKHCYTWSSVASAHARYTRVCTTCVLKVHVVQDGLHCWLHCLVATLVWDEQQKAAASLPRLLLLLLLLQLCCRHCTKATRGCCCTALLGTASAWLHSCARQKR